MHLNRLPECLLACEKSFSVWWLSIICRSHSFFPKVNPPRRTLGSFIYYVDIILALKPQLVPHSWQIYLMLTFYEPPCCLRSWWMTLVQLAELISRQAIDKTGRQFAGQTRHVRTTISNIIESTVCSAAVPYQDIMSQPSAVTRHEWNPMRFYSDLHMMKASNFHNSYALL